MDKPLPKIACWTPLWNPRYPGVGMEHLALSAHAAESDILGIDEDGAPFRMRYQLAWNERWELMTAQLFAYQNGVSRSLSLRADGHGHWTDREGLPMPALEGCIDIGIWPTPFTLPMPVRRSPLSIGERRRYSVAWVHGPALTCRKRRMDYGRSDDDRFRFESLDGTHHDADFQVDEAGLVIDCTRLFKRVRPSH